MYVCLRECVCVNETFQEENWNFQKDYIGSYLTKLPERFLEENKKFQIPYKEILHGSFKEASNLRKSF